MKYLITLLALVSSVSSFALCSNVEYEPKVTQVSEAIIATYSGFEGLKPTSKRELIVETSSSSLTAVERTYIDSEDNSLTVTVAVDTNCSVVKTDSIFDGF